MVQAIAGDALRSCKGIAESLEIKADLRAEMIRKLVLLHLEYSMTALRSPVTSDIGTAGPRSMHQQANELVTIAASLGSNRTAKNDTTALTNLVRLVLKGS